MAFELLQLMFLERAAHTAQSAVVRENARSYYSPTSVSIHDDGNVSRKWSMPKNTKRKPDRPRSERKKRIHPVHRSRSGSKKKNDTTRYFDSGCCRFRGACVFGLVHSRAELRCTQTYYPDWLIPVGLENKTALGAGCTVLLDRSKIIRHYFNGAERRALEAGSQN
jgi:hypothetical protein